jgi:hypothetical protein
MNEIHSTHGRTVKPDFSKGMPADERKFNSLPFDYDIFSDREKF